MEQHPYQPAQFTEPDCKEEKWEPEPQTAAFPGGSGAAKLLSERFVCTTHDAFLQAPELEASHGREHQADR
jgi:hypothetical protein